MGIDIVDIIDTIVAFFLMGVLFSIPICVLSYFIISLARYLFKKRNTDNDWSENHKKMKRATIHLAISSFILISVTLIIFGVIGDFFAMAIIFSIPVSSFVYFVFSLMKYKKVKSICNGDLSGENDSLKEAKRDLVTSSILAGFFALIIISLIYAFIQELFYM